MKIKLRRTFSSLLVSYLVTMVFTVSIGIVTYYGALREIEKDAADLNLSLLRQSSEAIDARLNEVESLVDQLSFHPKINAFLSITDVDGEEENDHYKAIDTWRYIQSYQFMSNFIYNFYISFINSQIIMSPKDMSYRMQMYYEESLNYVGMPYAEWQSEFMGRFHNGEYLPAQKIIINGKTNAFITYLQTVPLGFRTNFRGTLIVLIPEREVHSLLSRLNIQEGGWSVISDASGKTITSITDGNRQIDMTGLRKDGLSGIVQQQVNGEDMLVSYYTSPSTKWEYVSAVPIRVVMKKADYIRKTNTYILSVGLVIGMIIAIFFAYRNWKPIKTLEHSISRLMHSNAELHTELEKQAPLLRAAFFDRLFRGEFNDAQEVRSALDDVGIAPGGNRFAVAVLRLEELEDSDVPEPMESLKVKRVLVKDALRGIVGDTGFIHDLRQDQMAVLFCVTEAEPEAGRAYIDEAIARAGEESNRVPGLRVLIGIGGLYDELLDVYRSYNEAVKAQELVDIQRGESWLRYDQLPNTSTGYYYPLEIEQRIMNLVRSGNEAETRKLLADVHHESVTLRNASPDMLKLLVFDLSATVCKLIHDVAPSQPPDRAVGQHEEFLERIGSKSSFQDAYAHISQTLVGLCQAVSGQKKSHNVELKDSIIEFIEENYQDGNLGLAHVADRFGISEVYLSQFFKEQTGENFSSYMESKRMQRARELLSLTDLTVDEISKLVGYFNSNTFYKAFKRIEGVSPGTFRNKFRA
ncbi:helix-turn-helix domain-containing protein [Paenibacillus koleovorans]|uniref:helix-turn-helix domain-containing protein n=1 Tax=Paenibacillus koleovorans TaxID=121608 RepID=UPI000FD6EF6E|nr:helix-turn-helix domain-containing protein [Paenibacillus koleovorans]